MNKTQRYVNLLLVSRLGPIVRLYGIIEGKDGQRRCECRGWRQCGKSAGKHPRSRNWLELGTSDSRVLWSWLTLYPHSNFGILTGKKAIAIDLDNRPEEGKDGQAALAGIEMPDTVVSLSGSGNGSKHLYFNIPEQKLTSTLRGVDIKAEGGMCVSPGSLHLSGRYYTFEGIHLKDVCDMPKELIEMFTPRKKEFAKPSHLLTPFEQNNDLHARRQAASDQGVVRFNSFEHPPAGSRSAGALKPDWVVLQMIRKDSRTGPRYFEGQRTFRKPNGSFDRSRDDFALASALSFYCNHNWGQYVRLFCGSSLYGQKPGELYLALTLSKAFLKETRNSDDVKNKGGRPVSATTIAVLDLRSKEPHLRPVEIAKRLRVNPLNVYNILSRYKAAA